MIRMKENYTLLVLGAFIFLCSCGNKKPTQSETSQKPKIIKEFGYTLNDYDVVRDTVKRGDTFGTLLEKNELFYPAIFDIVTAAKKTFNIRNIQVGNKLTILRSKDSAKSPKAIVYQPNKIDYVVIHMSDSIWAEKKKKPVKLLEFEAEGIINSSLSLTLEEQGLSQLISLDLSDIYAWSIDFFRLEKGDRFKIIYTQKYIDDTIFVGYNRIHAAYFEHRKTPFYAIEFESNPEKGITEYFDENGKNLRRAFLQAPVQFSRISSRYNKRRKIAYYGRVRPHYGTDFAAPIGTPIRSTANGTVVKSAYKRGNGNYVTVKHNATYSTQYLHMKKRKVRVGDYVNQGDIIGTVGMTGNTSGPHVCYRFWKNGKQVDPFRQKLPEAKPISSHLKEKYLTYMEPYKNALDCIEFQYPIRNDTFANNN